MVTEDPSDASAVILPGCSNAWSNSGTRQASLFNSRITTPQEYVRISSYGKAFNERLSAAYS